MRNESRKVTSAGPWVILRSRDSNFESQRCSLVSRGQRHVVDHSPGRPQATPSRGVGRRQVVRNGCGQAGSIVDNLSDQSARGSSQQGELAPTITVKDGIRSPFVDGEHEPQSPTFVQARPDGERIAQCPQPLEVSGAEVLEEQNFATW